MPEIDLPNNWQPRPYQRPLWDYLEKGGKRAAACWHRRAGKDDIGLNFSAVSAFQRPANYWHMLPEYSQARKAIWEAVDPHTGVKRIDQAFPRELRRKTNDHEMFIEFKNGATWRVVGSDRFDALVGAGPAGIVFSEWSLSNPKAWAVLAPMLEENGGWALFIYTARGQNHGYNTIQLAKDNPAWFGQVLPATDSGVFTPAQLANIRAEYIALDSQNGESLFDQEYGCDFTAAIYGAFWAKEIAKAEAAGRICDVPHDPSLPVWTAWDLGVGDQTAIWFYQVVGGGLNIIDYYESSGVGVAHYAKMMGYTVDDPEIIVPEDEIREYGQYEFALVPHDAKVKEWGSNRTRIEQMMGIGLRPWVVPDHGLADGINAARMTIPLARFDKVKCKQGLLSLKEYRAEYDEERKVLKPKPLHNWASDGADAWRYLSMGWRAAQAEAPPKPSKVDFFIGTPAGTITSNLSIKEMIERKTRARKARES
jgi:phage terminase large subunit